MKTLGHISRFVSWLLILLPAALAVLYVREFGVSVVITDAWTMVPLFDKWSSGMLQMSDLFQQYNEHRIFFPKGVELLLGTITKYNNVPEMYLILVCFFITLVTLLLAFGGSSESGLFKKYAVLLFVPISLLIFSFRQHENMLTGFQISFAFAQTFGALAFFMLHTLERKRFKRFAFVVALGSATVASFSVVQGLFVWPLGLLQLFISPLEKPKKKAFIVLWGLAGLIEYVGYFVDYERPESAPPVLYALEHPLAGIEYFLDLLGSSLFWQQNFAFVGGLLLAGLAVASLLLIYRDGKLGECSFWISLLLYSFLIVVAITLGRAEFGVGPALIGQALVSRYTSFSILAVVSIYAMLVKTVFERRSRLNIILLVAMSGVMLLSALISYSEGIDVGSNEKVSKEKAAFILSTYESQPDQLLAESLLPSSAEAVRKQYAPILQRLGYNVFSESQPPGSLPPLSTLSPATSYTSFVVERLDTDAKSGVGTPQQNQSIVVPKEASFIKLTGWAVDTHAQSAAGGVYIDIDGKLWPAFYGMGRSDLVNHFGVPAYRYSGFERGIPVSEIGAGTHELSIIVLMADRTGYYPPNRKMVFDI